MKKLMVAAVVTLLSVGAFAGTTNYVDAVYGNDAWDGSAATHEEGTDIGPKKTLAAASKLLRANNYDVLLAAPGSYNEGVITNKDNCGIYGAAYYRVTLPATASLIATGTKEETFIYGAAATIDPDANGYGTNAVRCAFLNGAMLKGFTLLDGRPLYAQSKKDDDGSRCGGVRGGYVVDCVVSNCFGGRGAGCFSTTLIRTRARGNKGTNDNVSYVTAFNCIFDQIVSSGSTCYNCTLLDRGEGNAVFYNCASYTWDGGYNTTYWYSALEHTCGETMKIKDGSFLTTEAAMKLDAGYTPSSSSVLVNVGSNEVYEAKYPTSPLVAPYKDQDYYGNPRVVNGRIDIGAVEALSTLTVSDASTGLTVEGIEKGKATPIPAGGLTVSISRNYSSMPIVIGFRYGDDYIDFEAHEDGWTWTKTFLPGTASESIEAVYADKREWYVDAVNGNDENDGKRPGKGHARKTLQKIMALAKTKGDIVHAAPGVYDEGAMTDATYGSNRVVVADGVLLTADGGPDVTFIKGRKSDTTTGCGIDSLRCVKVDGNGALYGFTLTDGFAPTHANGVAISANNNKVGGGLFGGLAVECVVTNCRAPYNGAVSSCKLLRCTIGKNPGENAGYMSVRSVDSVWKDGASCYSYSYAYNSTFASSYIYPNTSTAHNCLFLAASGSAKHYNCISVSGKGSGTDEDGKCQFGVDKAKLPYDAETYRPQTGSLAVDSANPAYYVSATNGWCALWQSFVGKDYAKGQRVYNGTIDVGAGEHDWRGDFAKELAKKGVAVDVATPNVTTNLEAGLDVPAGESLRMKLVLKADGKVTFNVVAETGAVATVTAGGVPLTPGEGGAYGFEALAGETEVEIVVTGEGGKAVVSDVVLPKLGVLLLVR